jgi:hypothetical protein
MASLYLPMKIGVLIFSEMKEDIKSIVQELKEEDQRFSQM